MPTALPAGARLVGAWHLTAGDPRFGGLSALVWRGGWLVGLNDSGVVIRFHPPGTGDDRVLLQDLPDGPGPAMRKSSRDSEALLADPAGDGWWVAFEQYHSLWRFSRDFRRAEAHHPIDDPRWSVNRGIEGLLWNDGGPVAIAEIGDEAIRLTPSRRIAIVGTDRWISDAARLADGRALVVLRSIGLGGIESRVALLDETVRPMQVGPAARVAVGALANLEGAAVEPLAGGGSRLWLVSDNDFWRSRQTVLVAIDLPPGWTPVAS